MFATIISGFWCAIISLQITYFGNNVATTKTATKATTTTSAAKSKATIAAVTAKKKDDLPKVFSLSEDQAILEQLSLLYTKGLIEVCNDDTDVAFTKWNSMMLALEQYADKQNVNIKGVKMWIKVYWATDGTVEHIGYSLKPNSRNVKIAEFNALLKTFLEGYKLQQTGDAKFTNSGSVSFPIFTGR
ncbi:MAG: hypothetical protein RI894_1631 [Bacteroidota bacterium]|jgi:hypothetical protein